MRRNAGENVGTCFKVYQLLLKKNKNETFKQIPSINSIKTALDIQFILPVLENRTQRTSHPTKPQMFLSY